MTAKGTRHGPPLAHGPATTDLPGLRRWLPPLLIATAGVLAYLNSFGGVFQFDDRIRIVENPHIHALWPIWGWLCHGQRPVVNFTLAINYRFGALDVWGYHFVNLTVHILAALTLFGIVGRTVAAQTADSKVGRHGSGLAAAVALIWVVHPLGTQSVCYIIQRGESLMGLFYLLTLYCVIRGSSSNRRWWWYVAAVASCALGMGSKAVMVTAPVVVLLYDVVFLAGSVRRALRHRWALYVGLAATFAVLFGVGVVQGVLAPPAGGTANVGFGYKGVTPTEYLLSQPGVILHYLRLSFWPHPLCLDYGWPVAHAWYEIAIPGLLVGGLIVGTLWALLRRSWLGFAGAWFFTTLAPTSSFIPIRDLAFEHRMYLPLAAVVVVVVAAGRRLLDVLVRQFSLQPVALRLVGGYVLAVVVVLLGWSTAGRCKDYHSLVDIWGGVVRIRPDNARGHYNLAHSLAEVGRIDEAIACYQAAIDLQPGYVEAHYNLGHELAKLGRTDEAIPQYLEALRLKPDYVEAHNNLGYAYLKRNQVELAARHYAEALRLNPDSADAHSNLGTALAHQGKLDEAVHHYEEALRLDQGFASAHNNLGIVLALQGHTEEAVSQYHQALQINPNDAKSHGSVGVLLAKLGRLDEAIEHYRQALRINENNVDARYALAHALYQQDRLAEAADELRRILAIDPGNEDAQKLLEAVQER